MLHSGFLVLHPCTFPALTLPTQPTRYHPGLRACCPGFRILSFRPSRYVIPGLTRNPLSPRRSPLQFTPPMPRPSRVIPAKAGIHSPRTERPSASPTHTRTTNPPDCHSGLDPESIFILSIPTALCNPLRPIIPRVIPAPPLSFRTRSGIHVCHIHPHRPLQPFPPDHRPNRVIPAPDPIRGKLQQESILHAPSAPPPSPHTLARPTHPLVIPDLIRNPFLPLPWPAALPNSPRPRPEGPPVP